MSNPQMIPMVAPDGSVGEIPSDKVTEALGKQFRLGVKLQAPSGEIGIIPRDKLVQAVQTPGMHVLQDSAMYATPKQDASAAPWSLKTDPVLNDLGEMAKGTVKNAYQVSTPGVAASLVQQRRPDLTEKLPAALQPAPANDLPGQIAITALPMMVGAEELPKTAEAPKPPPAKATVSATRVADSTAFQVAKHLPYVGKPLRWFELLQKVNDAGREPPAAPEIPVATMAPRGGLPNTGKTPDFPPAADVIAANPGELARLRAIGSRNTATNVLPTENRGLALPPGQGAPAADVIAATPEAVKAPAEGATVPRVPSGEIVLNQALTSLDNPWLIKVAKSRGIDVTREVQLKPGAANGTLIKKIMDDFSPEEMENVKQTGLEISRFKPAQPQDMNPDLARELWHAKVVQTFFPDVKIPAAVLKRISFRASAAKAATATPDAELGDLLQRSIEKAKAAKTVQ